MAISHHQSVNWFKQHTIKIALIMLGIGVALPPITHLLAQVWVNTYHQNNPGVHQDTMLLAYLTWLASIGLGLVLGCTGFSLLVMIAVQRICNIKM